MSGEGRPEVSNDQAPCPSRAAGGIDRDRKVCEETMLHRSQTPRGPIVCVSPSFPPPIPIHPHQRGTTVVIEREYTATYCSHSGAWLSCLRCVHATGDRRPWRVGALRPSRVCSAFNMVNVPYMCRTGGSAASLRHVRVDTFPLQRSTSASRKHGHDANGVGGCDERCVRGVDENPGDHW